jgi:serine/threonine-protein kinase
MSTLSRLTTALDDRYRVESELGAGGMATVYRAHDRKHDRTVAIKVLRPELAYAVGSDRFLREIATTAAMRHPHILPLYDSGDADGLLYYVMPFVDGETLRDRLQREGRLPLDLALRIAREVADALGYAHDRGVAHRDIKPENILLERDHAVVADFGIARAVAATGAERLTQTGFAVGTPLYMSPEQAVGDANVDGRSDLYSLGCVLYEMLTGQPPFTGDAVAQITQQHLLAPPPRVTQARPEVHASIEQAIERALAKDPSVRPWPAARFIDALEPTVPVATAPPRHPATTSSGSRSRLGAVVAAVALLGGAIAWWTTRAVAPSEPPTAAAIGRIAVIPMDNQTGDTAQRFFADGMTREVIGVLADAGVRVLGYRAVAPYRGSTKPAREIAKELGVDAIVSGAVLRGGDVVRLSAELIDARSDETLWSRSFEQPATDVMSLQREVAREIARGIRAGLTPVQSKRLAATRQVNPKAYAQYLLGQEAAALRTTEGLRGAIDHLGRSLAIDSTYAPAWATLAIAHAYALIYQTAPRDSAYRTTMRAADRALALDRDLGDAWYARGVARLHDRWDFAGAFADFDSADARPSSSLGVGMAVWALWESGDHPSAMARDRALIEQEPTTAQWRSDYAWGLWSGKRAADAVASARTGIAADTTFYEIFDVLSLALAETGQHAAADSAHRRAVRVAGGDYWVRLVNEGFLASYRNDTAGVRRALKALEGDPRLSQRASLLLLLGDRDQAYALFDQAVAARDMDLLQMLNGMPPLFPFRQEPRYQALLAKIGLPERLRR